MSVLNKTFQVDFWMKLNVTYIVCKFTFISLHQLYPNRQTQHWINMEQTYKQRSVSGASRVFSQECPWVQELITISVIETSDLILIYCMSIAVAVCIMHQLVHMYKVWYHVIKNTRNFLWFSNGCFNINCINHSNCFMSIKWMYKDKLYTVCPCWCFGGKIFFPTRKYPLLLG